MSSSSSFSFSPPYHEKWPIDEPPFDRWPEDGSNPDGLPTRLPGFDPMRTKCPMPSILAVAGRSVVGSSIHYVITPAPGVGQLTKVTTDGVMANMRSPKTHVRRLIVITPNRPCYPCCQLFRLPAHLFHSYNGCDESRRHRRQPVDHSRVSARVVPS